MTSPVLTDRKRIPRRWLAGIWLLACAITWVALALLLPDSYQQDGGTHFLFARDAWWNHFLFVDVWGRPLFTTLYSLPALAGYLPAKLLTVVVSVVTAWQCWQWAEDEGLARPELAFPFFALQPSVMLLASDTMTEPLFALVLVVALRLRRAGRVRDALLVASLLPLARPEGFFVCLLWGVWTLVDARRRPAWWRRARMLPLLATGVVVWWVVALVIRTIRSTSCTTGRATGLRRVRHMEQRRGGSIGGCATTSSPIISPPSSQSGFWRSLPGDAWVRRHRSC